MSPIEVIKLSGTGIPLFFPHAHFEHIKMQNDSDLLNRDSHPVMLLLHLSIVFMSASHCFHIVPQERKTQFVCQAL